MEAAKEVKIEVLIFTARKHRSKLNVIYQLSRFQTLQLFKNHFRTQILTPKFRTYGNPMIDQIVFAIAVPTSKTIQITYFSQLSLFQIYDFGLLILR